MNDRQELDRYLTTRDAADFSRLVQRHADLVYAAARRQLADQSLAEDVTQAVFILLEQKAHRVKGPLAGWLITATYYTCRDARKLSSRREFHERQAAAMRSEVTMPSTPAADLPVWEACAPALDDALMKLNSRDRDALTLRYLKGMALRKVGTELGVTEEAARKRVDRALERLRLQLTTQTGVTFPSAGLLGNAILNHSLQTVPGYLITAVVAQSGGAATALLTTTGGTKATVALLVKGVSKTMLIAKLKFAAVVLASVVFATTGTTVLVLQAITPANTPSVQPVTAPVPAVPIKGYVARQFNSKVPMKVHVIIHAGDGSQLVGTTPSDKPIQIPACEQWWVSFEAPLADVVTEVKAQRIPGLQLPKESSDDDLRLLQDLTVLRMLDLSRTLVTDAGLEHLKNLTTLQELTLRVTKVTDAGLEQLKSLPILQTLDLAHTQVTDLGLEYLKDLTALQKLNLSTTKITDAGLMNLQGLKHLQFLDLSHTQITDGGLEQLKDLTRLQTLYLGDTQVTDTGLEYLKGLSALQTLDLWVTRVTDTGLAHIKGLTALRELNLWNTQVTDTGLEHLNGLTKLQILRLDRTQVTDARVAELKKSLPHVVIFWLTK